MKCSSKNLAYSMPPIRSVTADHSHEMKRPEREIDYKLHRIPSFIIHRLPPHVFKEQYQVKISNRLPALKTWVILTMWTSIGLGKE
jgi:hypothetical protein